MIRRGMVLWESIVALIIVGIIAVPLLRSFIDVDIWVYERLEVDRRLAEQMQDHLDLPVFAQVIRISQQTSAGREYWIEQKWHINEEQRCLQVVASDGNRQISSLEACRFEGDLPNAQ
jgi:hypothetical protein